MDLHKKCTKRCKICFTYITRRNSKIAPLLLQGPQVIHDSLILSTNQYSIPNTTHTGTEETLKNPHNPMWVHPRNKSNTGAPPPGGSKKFIRNSWRAEAPQKEGGEKRKKTEAQHALRKAFLPGDVGGVARDQGGCRRVIATIGWPLWPLLPLGERKV